MTSSSYNAKDAYDKEIASTYEKDRVVEPIWDKEQVFVRDFLKTVLPSSTILDLPVGTGRFLPYYAEFDQNVIGLDISENMLDEAKEKIGLFKNATQVKLGPGDITQLPLEGLSIDYSICWRLFHLLPEPVLATGIKELCRVTRKQILVQTFNVKPGEGVLSKIKNGVKPIVNAFMSVVAVLKGKSKEPWSHIQSYENNEDLILKKFRENHFELKKKDVIDFYKGQPVNVYLFERNNNGDHV